MIQIEVKSTTPNRAVNIKNVTYEFGDDCICLIPEDVVGELKSNPNYSLTGNSYTYPEDENLEEAPTEETIQIEEVPADIKEEETQVDTKETEMEEIKKVTEEVKDIEKVVEEKVDIKKNKKK